MFQLYVPASSELKVWLNDLDQKLWTHHIGHSVLHDPSYSLPKEKLTVDEWKKLIDLVKQHQFPCVPYCRVYGFALDIFDHAQNLDVLPPKLLSIDQRNIPPEDAHMVIVGGILTHTFENRTILKRYRALPALEEPGHYEY